ncbi:FHA domain-containing protein [Luteimonas sp. BDR2-5]|uniref:FHA domain-containing protein n=1 Tax=Proluteimonas luteida TaxID=2878685 RepID=UPI001E34D990|nr:FHA domain-containing protein [Luteimonas sp. BDR2-5]MCD9029456.1 FHA domain-containing protein [Luteimonas sp. BDR2-5]
MTQRNDNPSDRRAHNVLRIVDGLHAGANRVLASEEMILVGSGEDCDIVLADDGVANHHALVTLLGGRFMVRALDAPLKIGGQTIQPGDPVELTAVQQIALGDAAIAFGREDDPDWDNFLTVFAPDDESEPARSGLMRRLPLIAGVAALSLASLAIFAAVLPDPQPQADSRARLTALMDEHRITDFQVKDGANGVPMVVGTVDSGAVLQRVRDQLDAEGIRATLEMRTGENIAGDVAEIFRAQGIPVQARYVGNGDVEVVGDFSDGSELETLVRSRAVSEIPGVARILPRTPAGRVPQGGGVEGVPAAAPDPVHIVSIVRGDDPHLLAADGSRYVAGDDVPGKGRLISIGEFAHVLAPSGELTRIIPGPVPEPADAPADALVAEVPPDVDPAFAGVVASVRAGDVPRHDDSQASVAAPGSAMQ